MHSCLIRGDRPILAKTQQDSELYQLDGTRLGHFDTTSAFSRNVLPAGVDESALHVDPYGVSLSLVGSGTKPSEFDRYALVPHTDDERREVGTNSGQSILLPCYNATKISTQLHMVCYKLVTESKVNGM